MTPAHFTVLPGPPSAQYVCHQTPMPLATPYRLVAAHGGHELPLSGLTYQLMPTVAGGATVQLVPAAAADVYTASSQHHPTAYLHAESPAVAAAAIHTADEPTVQLGVDPKSATMYGPLDYHVIPPLSGDGALSYGEMSLPQPARLSSGPAAAAGSRLYEDAAPEYYAPPQSTLLVTSLHPAAAASRPVVPGALRQQPVPVIISSKLISVPVSISRFTHTHTTV